MYDLEKYMSQFPTFFDVPTFKDLFDSLSRDFREFGKSSFPYPVNLYTNYSDKQAVETVLEVALAGFTKDEIKVKIEDNMLSVVVEKEVKESSENDNFKFHTRGIAKRNASISYTLAPTADADNVKVSFNDGILKVVVPVKKEELDKHTPKYLEIQ